MTTPVTEYLRTLTTAGHQSLIQAGPRGGRPTVTPADLKRGRGAWSPSACSGCSARSEVAAGMAFPADYDWNVLDANGKPTQQPRPREDGRKRRHPTRRARPHHRRRRIPRTTPSDDNSPTDTGRGPR